MRRRFLGKPALSVAVLAVVLAATALATIAAAPPNLHRAIETQRHLAAERPQDPGVWNDLGNLLLVAGQIAEAEAAYQRAVQLDPKKVSALFNLGLLDQQRGDEEEAMRLYKRAVEADPRHAWTHYQIGTIYEKRGNKQKAIREYGEAFSLDPQLGFPEVNPEVVESNLTTEAMLHAYKHGISSGTGASRQYGAHCQDPRAAAAADAGGGGQGRPGCAPHGAEPEQPAAEQQHRPGGAPGPDGSQIAGAPRGAQHLQSRRRLLGARRRRPRGAGRRAPAVDPPAAALRQPRRRHPARERGDASPRRRLLPARSSEHGPAGRCGAATGAVSGRAGTLPQLVWLGGEPRNLQLAR